MAGGIVAALIGPTLARFGRPLFQHLEYIGSFLIISIISLVAMGILSSLHIADTVEQKLILVLVAHGTRLSFNRPI